MPASPRAFPEPPAAPGELADATFRIRSFGGLSVVAGCWKQPRRRHAIAWLRLSDTDNERAGGTTAALLLAGFGCPR
jgi:hypothetical protein